MGLSLHPVTHKAKDPDIGPADAAVVPLRAAASRHSANTNQIALAWLLAVSPLTLPIPGTATPAHLEDNLAAAALQLEQDEIHAITTAASRAA